MLSIISPAKSLEFNIDRIPEFSTIPNYLNESERLVSKLKKLKPKDLEQLMSISTKLANENFERYQRWSLPFTPDNSRQAVLMFKGDVYSGLDAHSLSDDDLDYAQNHLRILSGLYGVLRPMDLIQEYRLEMGTAFSYRTSKNLYEYWGDKITQYMGQRLSKIETDVIVNLASNEYFKVLNKEKLGARIITPVFQDYKNGTYKMISFYAKRARGMMTRFIIQNKIEDPEQLKLFEEDGYFYNDNMSEGDKIVFTRG
jgi:cytoplasmic iron level regulating protein YaaA (DUF328/UPF0246 family)